MKDSLSYRVSGDGEAAFNGAVRQARKWMEDAIKGPLKIAFSLSLKAVAPDGESVQTIGETKPLPLAEVKPLKRKPKRSEPEPSFAEEK